MRRTPARNVFAGLAGGLVAVILGACAPPPGPVQPEPFALKDLAKSDVDTVAEVHLEAVLHELRLLMEKLYKRNPREWKRTGKPSMEYAIGQTFDTQFQWEFRELMGKHGTDCISLTFDPSYRGDRVLAFVVGLTSMVLSSYNFKVEFFVFDQLDPQKLYNSARNVEIAVWKLANERDPDGGLYLLSNSLPGEPRNLSYERLFGKIIALQDAMAVVAAGRTNRQIKYAVHRVAGAVFLPI